MHDAGSKRATAAYGRANLARQRAVVADARRVELAIVAESDECFGHVMADYRAGVLSDATFRRRLDSFAIACRDVIDRALHLGARDWWRSAVELFGAAADADPRIMAAVALQPGGPLRESVSTRAAFTILQVFAPPKVLEVLSIVNAPVNGKTWKERLSQMTADRVPQSRLARVIADAYAAGGNIGDVERAIKPVIAVTASAARTIARTESMRVANTMHERSMDAAGDVVIGFTRRAVLDTVTRPEHARASGRVFKKGEPRPSMPDGPNCRCWYDPILDTDVTVFGRPGSIPPEARHVEAFARWFDVQTPGRRVAVVGPDVYAKASSKAGGGVPTWEQIGDVAPNIESDRIRGHLDERAATAIARRRGAA